MNLFYTSRDEGNSKNKAESRKMGCDSLRCISIAEFHLY